MADHTTIRIKEKSFAARVFGLEISFRAVDGSEEETEVQLPDPYDAKTDALLEWYFEQYISAPYDDVKVVDAVKCIEDYGLNLFQHLFKDDLLYRYRTALQNDGPRNITFEIVGDSPGFQAIFWESLRDPKQAYPFAALGTIFARRNLKSLNVKAIVRDSPTINILMVTARPNEENDVNYRTIQRPLIDLINKTQTPVRPHILRPGTYEALIKHLDQKEGYYHIIHFDLHGSLMDYTAYKQFEATLQTFPFDKETFKSRYGLKQLGENDFFNGKKAFVFFESEEKGVAVPVEATQLADLLEHKQIPICILNACQSAKQDNSANETSLGRVLIQKGIQLVLAMRYSVSVSAAGLMMEMLYARLYQQESIEEAIANCRKELFFKKERKAAYEYRIEMEDWLLPVMYQNGRPRLNLRQFTPDEEKAYVLQNSLPDEARQEFLEPFFGRDLDILKIEKNLLLRSNMLLLQGMGGAGKTTLLKHLADWWVRTGFVQRIFYFGYDSKAHTQNEILSYIAKQIYSDTEMESFMAKLPAVQEHNIVKALTTGPYALILDNTESITGEKLAIPHTLPVEERKALKRFLTRLKGGRSPVIIGSRANEDWLKEGTFENNVYLLKGLDPASAASFAHSMLKDLHLPAESICKDRDFERLMKLLAGYPLALKAILPNLKQKTTKSILKELEEGVGDLDKGNEQQRTESIIKCIEYAHSNLSEDAQQLLLCFAPFQSIVNLEASSINTYFAALKKSAVFQHYPFEKTATVVREAIQNGFMQEEPNANNFRLMSLQPVFTFFLKNKLITEDPDLQSTIQLAYTSFYTEISKTLNDQIDSFEPAQQKSAICWVEYEYENLYKVLRLLMESQTAILPVFSLIDKYLTIKQLHQKRLEVAELVHKEIAEYMPQDLSSGLGLDYQWVKHILATIYKALNQLDRSEETLHEILNVLETHGASMDSLELYEAGIYQDLGNIAREKQEIETGVDYFKKALVIYTSYKDTYRQAEVFHNLGTIFGTAGRYGEARQSFNKALAIYQESKDLEGQGQMYYYLGKVASAEGDFPTAISCIEKAIGINQQYSNNRGIGLSFMELGLIGTIQAQYDTARYFYKQALDIYIHLNDLYQQAEIFKTLGRISCDQQDFITASRYFEKALDIFLKFPEDRISILRILEFINNYVSFTNDKSFGQKMVKKALPYFEGKEESNQLKEWLDSLNQT